MSVGFSRILCDFRDHEEHPGACFIVSFRGSIVSSNPEDSIKAMAITARISGAILDAFCPLFEEVVSFV